MKKTHRTVRKKRLNLSFALMSLVVVALIIFLGIEKDNKKPVEADVFVPKCLAEFSGNVGQQGEQNISGEPLTSAELGFGIDHLNPAEEARALALVMSDSRVVQCTQNVRHTVAQVQRRQEPKDIEVRRADVLIYVYSEDFLLHGIANLKTNVVDDVFVTQNYQPLITQDEASHALNILLNDARTTLVVREHYEQITGTPFISADQLRQLQVTAGVYHASDYPSQATAKDCGLHRCAQLLLFDRIPIVDLSTEKVVDPDQ